MKRSLKGSILALLGLGILLAGCGANGIGSLPGFDVQVGLTPTSLGFEVDEDGTITVTSHVVTFSSAPGSVGAVATGFEVVYYEQDGSTFFLGSEADSTFLNDGAFSHPIPAGLVCAESVPCRVTSPDAQYQRVQSEPLSNVVTLPGVLAQEILARGEAAGVADFTFFVTTDNGGEVEIPARVQFTYPVAGGE
jgi:hypothetical protein